jgi:hypothetical protein
VIETPASVATSARRGEEERRWTTTVAWWRVTATLRNGLRKP